MKYKLQTKSLNNNNKIRIITSKSDLHRVLFASLLARGTTTIKNVILCDDVIATINVLKAINCNIKYNDDELIIDSSNIDYDGQIINCNESGTTLRLMIPIFIYLFGYVVVDTKNSLRSRPLTVYFEIFDYDKKDYPITFKGKLPSNYEIAGNISSQFISGLLFVLPLLCTASTITFSKQLQSVGYVDMTINTLRRFGININSLNKISGKQTYLKNITYVCESDYSNYAFFAVANYLGAQVQFDLMPNNSSQPDRVIDKIIADNSDIIDLANSPDLLPIITLYSCFRKYPTKIINIYRNKFKESNRIVAICDNLIKLGAKINYNEDEINVLPVTSLKAGDVSAYTDHRIAMTMAIASLKSPYIIIDNLTCINKSYPMFIHEFKKLGGEVCLIYK